MSNSWPVMTQAKLPSPSVGNLHVATTPVNSSTFWYCSCTGLLNVAIRAGKQLVLSDEAALSPRHVRALLVHACCHIVLHTKVSPSVRADKTGRPIVLSFGDVHHQTSDCHEGWGHVIFVQASGQIQATLQSAVVHHAVHVCTCISLNEGR